MSGGQADKPAGSRQLILASASPRRRELLAEAGYDFRVEPAQVDEPEDHLGTQEPSAFAQALSFFKARSVAERLGAGVILGADTVVALDGEIFGKAKDAADARRILATLMRNPHEVITAVTLLDAASGMREIAYAVTRVTMTPMSPEQLDAYIAGGLWEGKAGAYGIQDHDDAFVQRLEGSYSNVMGLPMEMVARMLARWGIEPRRNAE